MSTNKPTPAQAMESRLRTRLGGDPKNVSVALTANDHLTAQVKQPGKSLLTLGRHVSEFKGGEDYQKFEDDIVRTVDTFQKG